MQLRGKRQAGFTIVEVLIATGLLMAVAAVALHFITNFNRMGDRMNTLATMEEALRTSLNRIEREMIEASAVLPEHPDDSSIATGKNRVVLGIPLYSDAGFVAIDDDGNPLLDIMVLETLPDNTAELLRNRTNTRSQRLLFSIDTQTQSNRQDIDNQVIARDLMPKTTSGTNAGNYLYPGSMSGPQQGTFVYLAEDGSEIDPSSGDLSQVSQVKVLLWAEKNHREGVLTSRKEIEVRLRNWGEIL
ncbi:MAG: type II secretion system protein [Candidatus Sericytochromatia bacterium]|nr:type II secretion system protein [Candidatus Sericytochromatia bacterium]